MNFGALQKQDKFFARRDDHDLVLKKVDTRLAADVTVSGDGRVFEFSPGEDVGDVLTDAQAEAKLQELAEARRQRQEQPEPLMAGYVPSEEKEEHDHEECCNPAAINKMKRAELDALAAEHEIDLGDMTVEESREYLIAELCQDTEAEEANA